MKKILGILFLSIAFITSFGQTVQPRGSSSFTYLDQRLMTGQNFYPPRTPCGGNLNGGLDTTGALIFSRCDSAYYMYVRSGVSSGSWIQILSKKDSTYIKTLGGGGGGDLSNYYTKAQSDARYYPLVGNPSNFLTTVTNPIAGTGISVTGSYPSITIGNTGVLSFNSRSGVISLTSLDVTNSLGFIPVASVQAGTNVSITGNGSPGNPYIINSSGGGTSQNFANTDLIFDGNRSHNVNGYNLNISGAAQINLASQVVSNTGSTIALAPANTTIQINDVSGLAGDYQNTLAGARIYNKNGNFSFSTLPSTTSLWIATLDSIPAGSSPFTQNPVPLFQVKRTKFTDIGVSKFPNDAGYLSSIPGLNAVTNIDSTSNHSMSIISSTAYNPTFDVQNTSTVMGAQMLALGRLYLWNSGANVQIRAQNELEIRDYTTPTTIRNKFKTSGALQGNVALASNDFTTLQQMMDSITAHSGGGGGSISLTAGAGLTANPSTLTNVGSYRVTLNGIVDTLLRKSAAWSIIGNQNNSLSNVADIDAWANNTILVRQNDTLGFALAQDYLFLPFATRAAITAYGGAATFAYTNERAWANHYTYIDTSTRTVDNRYTLSATGKGGGRWLLDSTWNSGGGGGGGVSSVGLTMPTGFSVSGSPVTSSGTLAVTTTLNGYISGNGSGFTASSTIPVADVTGAATTSTAQNLTSKTLTSPIINVTSDATGDIYYRNSGGAFTRLPIGSTNQILTVVSGLPSWQTGGGGGGNVTKMGTINNATPSANGAVINTVGSVDSLVMQDASSTMPGLVTINAQTFAGDKTFNGVVAAGSGFYTGTNISNATIQLALNSTRNTTSPFKIEGQSSSFRIAERGSATMTLQANDAGVNHGIYIQGIAKATSGTHPWLAQMYIDTFTVTNPTAGGVVTAAANLVVSHDPRAMATTEGYLYAAYINGSIKVNGALGLGVKSFSASTLTVDSSANVYVFTGSTSTVTLPALGNSKGWRMKFKNMGSGTVTIQGAASNLMVDQGTTSATTTISLTTGQAAEIVNDSSHFLVLYKQ